MSDGVRMSVSVSFCLGILAQKNGSLQVFFFFFFFFCLNHHKNSAILKVRIVFQEWQRTLQHSIIAGLVSIGIITACVFVSWAFGWGEIGNFKKQKNIFSEPLLSDLLQLRVFIA